MHRARDRQFYSCTVKKSNTKNEASKAPGLILRMCAQTLAHDSAHRSVDEATTFSTTCLISFCARYIGILSDFIDDGVFLSTTTGGSVADASALYHGLYRLLCSAFTQHA